MSPLILMVGADKGGVGKTTVTRALDDYLRARAVARRVFDTEWPLGDLKRFAADAEVVDVEKVKDQMKVFDAADGVTVVDVRAGLLSPILRALDQAALLDDVKSGAVGLVLLHVLGPSVASLNEIADAAKAIGGGSKHFVVKNRINETEFDGWDQDPRYAAMFERMLPATINIPHLPADACEAVQKLGVSFSGFAADKSQSRMLTGYVRTWLRQVSSEFDRVGLGELAGSAAAVPAAT